MFSDGKNKAASPYGFSTEFYQGCCQFIKHDIGEMFNDFYKGTLDIKRINYGIVTLLPKVKKASKIQQFRLICLLNYVYKWFTKLLTMRLEPVAQRIIHKAQAVIIGGRNIMNTILALYEILHETKKR
jgi:hypothetical protein